MHMSRAIDLAKLGIGMVSPNPLVGCVLVKDGKIIGEGFHQKFGEAHAEVNAVNSVEDKTLLEGATAFVTLEPCNHQGKTPPCTDLLIRSKIAEVIIGSVDPNPKVYGKGINHLKNAGIKVESGFMQAQCEFMNRRFFTFHNRHRPHIILKWARTLDGFIARKNLDSKWISNSRSRQIAHQLRVENDAIMVGKTTAAVDNPQLNARNWYGNSPKRGVLDLRLEVPDDHHLFDRKTLTWVFNAKKDESEKNLRYVKVDAENPEQAILRFLHGENIQSLVIEGGSRTLQGFIDKGLWDEAYVFQAKKQFQEGVKEPFLTGTVLNKIQVEGDELWRLINTH